MPQRTLFSLLLAALTAALPAGAAEARDPAFDPVTDDPKLPRVLLIGDSISIGYTVPVRKALAGAANVHRIPENGGPTTNGLKNLDRWLGSNKWDVIHFNWGLHDLKMITNGGHMVLLVDYEKNLGALVARMKKTGATLTWAATTPVPEGRLNPPRRPSDVGEFNRVAKKVMEAHGVAINDLYSFTLPHLKEWQRPVNVHFTPEGSKRLGEEVASAIRKALASRAK